MGKKRSDGFIELEERYAGYEVYDRDGHKLGKVDDLFVDENDRPEYLGVKMDILPRKPTLAGSRATLIPVEVVRVDEGGRYIEVSAEKDHVTEGPAFDDDWEITPPFEESVRRHYGIELSEGAVARGAYGAYYEDEGEERRRVEREPIDVEQRGMGPPRGEGSAEGRPGTRTGDDVEGREFSEHSPEQGGAGEPGTDELRVRRGEEELGAETREREAGRVRIRKRVHADREQVSVPTKHEEVSVQRVPLEGREAPEAEIGEDEAVEKRPATKEEIRIQRDTVQGEEVLQGDVRREEVDVEDRADPDGESGDRVAAGAIRASATEEAPIPAEETTGGSFPGSGGLAVGSVRLPAAALLVGLGILAYIVLRRRR
ncbi:MAG: DUF2382 domain-containing protein [Actinomycetota bacterium]|nr:DUF2382 domain-containing protein [Actinomycetota bacterium]